MGIEEVKLINKIFSELKLKPVYLEHEEVLTSEGAARVRGISLKQGIKALLFTNGKNEWIITDVAADKKVNQKKVAEILGWSKKDVRLATPEEVLEQTGCQIGSVPPFGHKNNLKIIVDRSVFDNIENDFNIGLRTHSAKVKTAEMKIVFKHVGAEESEFSK